MPGTTPLTDATGQDIVIALQALTAAITAQTAQLSELTDLPYTPTPYT